MKLVLFVLAAAAPVHAQCVTAADANTGIRVTFENTDVTTIRALGDNLYEVDETFSQGTQRVRYRAYYATYNISYGPMIGDVMDDPAQVYVDWGVDPLELPVPSLQSPQWSGQINEYDAIFAPIAIAKRSIRFDQGTPINLGDCTYEVVTVEMRSTWQGDAEPQLQFWSYLPDLGISFIVGTTSTPGNFVETAVTSIEAM